MTAVSTCISTQGLLLHGSPMAMSTRTVADIWAGSTTGGSMTGRVGQRSLLKIPAAAPRAQHGPHDQHVEPEALDRLVVREKRGQRSLLVPCPGQNCPMTVTLTSRCAVDRGRARMSPTFRLTFYTVGPCSCWGSSPLPKLIPWLKDSRNVHT